MYTVWFTIEIAFIGLSVIAALGGVIILLRRPNLSSYGMGLTALAIIPLLIAAGMAFGAQEARHKELRIEAGIFEMRLVDRTSDKILIINGEVLESLNETRTSE